MKLDGDGCYQALRSRDVRFDGLFFVGVRTTGIYCRPICPARLPARARCEFFASAAEAERAGFRACFRCRPELAPGAASVDSGSRLSRSVVARIDAGFLNEHSLDDLARELGVSSRHVRRVVETELGVSPVELAQTRRLALAKQLLHDTGLPLADVALSAGFASIRRFNALFRSRFGRAPSALRRGGGGEGLAATKSEGASDGALSLRLDYRPPFAWQELLAFLRARAVPGIDEVGADEYRRRYVLPSGTGTIVVRPDAERAALRAEVSVALAPALPSIVARLRALFDLDARPDVIARHLGSDARLRTSLRAVPGLRVPGAFDGFELGLRAVLGQQVSVRAATTLMARLVTLLAGRIEAERVAELSSAALRAIGLPSARADAVRELARRVRTGRIDLARGADPERTRRALESTPGIGPWTAQYVLMRALGWPDAFPATDLVLRRALGVATPRIPEERSAAWRPWRSYAVVHLWRAAARRGGSR